MPTFAYTIRDQTGALRKGSGEAESENILARRLREQGFQVASIKQTKAPATKKPGGGFGRVGLTDLSIFCRQFSTMIDAGVSLVRCLSVLAEQTANNKLKAIVLDIQKEVEAGQTLSASMRKYPRVFSNLFVGLVRAGEVGGVLEESLQRLSQFLEKDVELRRKVKSAMTYPVIVMVVATAIVLGLVLFILPKFMQLFTDLGMKPDSFPVMTKMLMDFSHFVLNNAIPVGIAVIIFVVLFKMFIRTKFGKRMYDRFKLNVPVFGNLNHKICLARFSRTLGTLLVSGVPILQALETVAGTVDNDIISEAVLTARSAIREGERIGDPLQKSKYFPPMVVQMISIGEESGALDQMLTKIADFYEQEVDTALASLTSAIEPIMIVFLGGAVGFIVIAMFLPLVGLIQGLSGGGGDDEK